LAEASIGHPKRGYTSPNLTDFVAARHLTGKSLNILMMPFPEPAE
jgi:hypothetical protein